MHLNTGNTMTKACESVVGIILAGGLARRMGGGDKCLLTLGGKTLLERTMNHAKPQVTSLILNANGDAARFAHTQLPVVADNFPNYRGPLAGIHAGLQWMSKNTSHTWMASFASDTPFFPFDIVEQLFAQTLDRVRKKDEMPINLVVAKSHQEAQSVFALWHLSLLEKIDAQLKSEKIPRLQDWIKEQHTAYVEFSSDDYDPFFNINTPEDLVAAESILSKEQ